MKKINITLNIDISFEIRQVKLNAIIKEIAKVFHKIAQNLFQEVITELNKAVIEWIRTNKTDIQCTKCGNRQGFTKRGFRNDKRGIATSIGNLFFPQLQMIECPECHLRFSPVLQVLGIEKYQRISDELKLKGVQAALHLPYRLARKVLSSCTGISISVRSIWTEVQKLGSRVKFDIDSKEEATFGADGTGLPIKNSGKRGKELKIIAQYKKDSSVRICGLGIGNYKKDWDFAEKITNKIRKTFSFPLMCGDGGLYKELKGYLRGVKFQRDLWHMYHSLKHVLWEEGIKRSSDDYRDITGQLFSIIKLPKDLKHKDIDYKKLNEKLARMDTLIDKCRELGYQKIVTYLSEAKNYLFTFSDKKFGGRKLVKTSSLIERIMREVNFRIDVAGAWSDRGSLNMCKLRLGVLYNDLNLENLYDINSTVKSAAPVDNSR